MIWIEFAGLVGSGKTSLVRAVQSRLDGPGILSSFMPGNEIDLEQSKPGPISAKDAGSIPGRTPSLWYQLLFSVQHPRCVQKVLGSSQARAALPTWHRERILRLFFKLAGRYEQSRHQQSRLPLLIDEGFTHRAVNLFAWQDSPFNPHWARAYLEHLPEITRVIFVHASVEECLDRALQRGLPETLRGKSDAAVRQFMENSARIMDLAEETFRKTGQAFSIVTNSGSLDLAAQKVHEELVGLNLARQSLSGPVKRPNHPSQSRVVEP